MSDINHTDEQISAMRDALGEAIGDAYDCVRAWSAWSVGTMGPNDFLLVCDDDSRMHELAISALDAAASVDAPAPTNEVLEMMESHGGSFIKSLAHCYLMADPENKRRLRVAMRDWFADYASKVSLIEENQFVDRAMDRYREGVEKLHVEGKLPRPEICTRPPEGWECSRAKDHEGPCAASAINHNNS